MPPRSRGLVPRPVVQTSPVLARYLDDLAQQARLAAAAADARRMDIHFGRVQPEDPFAGIGQDEIADMVGATAAPRRWLEADAYNKSIEGLMPSGPGEPFADILNRHRRSQDLTAARLAQLTPEQRAGSLGYVAQQAQADAGVRRARQIAQDEANKAAFLAGAVAAGGVGAISVFAPDMMEAEREARRDRDIDEGIRRSMSEIKLYDDTPVIFDANIPSDDEVDDYLMSNHLQDDRYAGLTLPSPEEAVASSPGPQIAVIQEPEVEELPGPQLRSIKALMRGGIPEGRARDIILKGSSMSPDEYRMVTGGRR